MSSHLTGHLRWLVYQSGEETEPARREGRLRLEVSTGQPDFYRFDEGQRESIRRIISKAKSMLSRNAISRAGEGLPSSTDSFRHAKIAAMTPRVRLRPSSISFSIGVLRKNLRQRKGTPVYYFFSRHHVLYCRNHAQTQSRRPRAR
jgi:hypothetical protein